MKSENKYIRIESIEQLKEESKGEDGADFFILLRGCRSSKHITWDADNKLFYIFNEIDDSDQEVTEADLMDETNIGNAINNKAFFKYAD